FNLQGGGGAVFDPLLPVTAPQVQITVTSGGNPSLSPEEADTKTAGFVYQKGGLQLSVDWYDIQLSEAVGQVGAQNIVNGCYQQGRQNLCAFVQRDANGVIGNVRDVFQNINEARVRGIDYELLLNAEPNFAKNQSEALTFRFLAGRLLEESTTLLGGPTPDFRDVAGRWYEPDLKLLASVRYSIGAWGVSFQQRYLPETRLDGGLNPVQATGVDGPNWVEWQPGMTIGALPTGAFTIDNNTVQSKSYTDVVLAYDGEMRSGHTWEASLAITNLLDEDPVVIPSFDTRFSSQLTTGNNFDIYGRRYLASFRYRF
ncbi:MAG TPA: TonB-dependent receptor, partial [Gammaproteobacteria bacterium]|nr:TonB-dependent receptor [Gammaproteobacteria bacterium]